MIARLAVLEGVVSPENRAAFDAGSSGYYHDASTRSVWVKVAPSAQETMIELQ